MRTTGNVMGVQAQFILERIDETWKILKRRMQDAQGGYLFTDKAHAAATAAEDASAEGGGEADAHNQVLVGVQSPVFDDHRLTTELPEPNWGIELPLQAAFITDTGRGSQMGNGLFSRSTNSVRTRQKKKRAGLSILHLLGRMARPEKASASPNEPQETRSAPAPPNLSGSQGFRYLGPNS